MYWSQILCQITRPTQRSTRPGKLEKTALEDWKSLEINLVEINTTTATNVYLFFTFVAYQIF